MLRGRTLRTQFSLFPPTCFVYLTNSTPTQHIHRSTSYSCATFRPRSSCSTVSLLPSRARLSVLLSSTHASLFTTSPAPLRTTRNHQLELLQHCRITGTASELLFVLPRHCRARQHVRPASLTRFPTSPPPSQPRLMPHTPTTSKLISGPTKLTTFALVVSYSFPSPLRSRAARCRFVCRLARRVSARGSCAHRCRARKMEEDV